MECVEEKKLRGRDEVDGILLINKNEKVNISMLVFLFFLLKWFLS